MTPKEIAEKIEKGIAGIPRWRMFWDFKVGDLADFVADYKRQAELLEEARNIIENAYLSTPSRKAFLAKTGIAAFGCSEGENTHGK